MERRRIYPARPRLISAAVFRSETEFAFVRYRARLFKPNDIEQPPQRGFPSLYAGQKKF